MTKLLMLKGLIASGKSTYARELVEQGWKRVNKDDLRAMVDSGKWSKENEQAILNAEISLVKYFLKSGYNVVVDDTNFAHEKTWRDIVEDVNDSIELYKDKIEFEVKEFNTPITECILRDASRGDKAIGVKNIQRMYDQHVKPIKNTELLTIEQAGKAKLCYIFDIDGTLAHMHNRSPYDYSKVNTDKVDRDVLMLNKIISQEENVTIFIVSGRNSDCRQETEVWLKENRITYNELFMRPAGDKRADYIIKKELYEKNIKDNYHCLGVFDDRQQVVDMWRSLGLTCYQCAYGFF